MKPQNQKRLTVSKVASSCLSTRGCDRTVHGLCDLCGLSSISGREGAQDSQSNTFKELHCARTLRANFSLGELGTEWGMPTEFQALMAFGATLWFPMTIGLIPYKCSNNAGWLRSSPQKSFPWVRGVISCYHDPSQGEQLSRR